MDLLPDDAAMDGPNTHRYQDAPAFVTDWTVVPLTAPDGTVHRFHVPTAALKANPTPEPTCGACGHEAAIHYDPYRDPDSVPECAGTGRDGLGCHCVLTPSVARAEAVCQCPASTARDGHIHEADGSVLCLHHEGEDGSHCPQAHPMTRPGRRS